jgi:Tfp pilus assembly protein PilF
MTESTGRRNQAIGLCLAMVTAVVYWPVTHFGFVNYDDPYYVYENPHLRAGLTLQGIVWAFTTNYRSNWHPVTWMSHLLDYQLFGLNAGGHHLVNVLLHVASAWLLFHVLYRMTAAPWRSAFVAAVFALHPLHVESVAWVTERKDVLSALFWMLTMWAYVRYVEQPGRHRYLLALGLYALGLMAKPMLVTLPFVLLLLDYWPLRRTAWLPAGATASGAPPAAAGGHARIGRLLLEKLPFVVLAVGSCVVTFWAQHTGGAVESLGRLPLDQRIANAMVSYVRYLAKTLWPVRLAVFYPYGLWPRPVVLGAGIALIVATALAIGNARRRPPVTVGWLWYLSTLVPVIGLVQVGAQAMADRYMYLPMIGLLIIVAWSVPRRIAEHPFQGRLLAAGAAVLLAVCAALCRIQVGYWRSSETLFRHALAITPGNPVAHNNLGSALKTAGRTGQAIQEFEEALRLDPKDWRAQLNLGICLLELGRFADAIQHLRQAVRTEPRSPVAHNTLGVALLNAGQYEEAASQFERALELDALSAEPHYNLGLVMRKQGRIQEAIAHFEQAVRLKPGFAKAREELATLRGGQ